MMWVYVEGVEQRLVLLSHSEKVLGLVPCKGRKGPFCVCRFSGFLPQAKNMHVRWTGDDKLLLDVNRVVCVSALR